MFWMIVIWAHIIAAMFWIGGTLFFAFVLVPCLKESPPEERTALISRVGKRFRTSGWIALGVLLLTGLLGLYQNGISPWDGGRPAWRIKLFLVFVMVLLTLLHDVVLGPKSIRISLSAPGPHRLQKTVRLLARINLLVGLSIVLAAVYLVRAS